MADASTTTKDTITTTPDKTTTIDIEGCKACPWCGVVWFKDNACNWVCCGHADIFYKHIGCGRQFCWQCNKRLCGKLYTPDGTKTDAPTSHTHECCRAEAHELDLDYFADYCQGGHNSHK